MNDIQRWHADVALLARYAGGHTEQVVSASIETHLVNCARCRSVITPMVNGARVARGWDRVAAAVDQPVRGPVEVGLVRVGVAETTARLLAATPSLRLSWTGAVAFALTFAVVAATRGRASVLPFLVIAPLLPLAGVGVAFGPGVDPAYEIALVAPLRSGRLLLLRAAAVLGVSSVLALVAGLALPGPGWVAAAWMLPSLGLTLASLALSTFAAPWRAAAGVAAAWVGTVVIAVQLSGDVLAPFGAAGQAAATVVAAVSVVVFARRADRLDSRSQA